MRGHEREVYIEIRSTFIQSVVTGQVKMLTQENKLATDYIAKFNEYLNRCGAIEFESSEHTLSRFKSGLRDNYRRELIARGITTLKQAYQLVTDLDESRGSHFHRSDFRGNSKTTTASKPSYNRSFSVPSKPASSSSSVNNVKSTTFEKKTTSEPVKVNPRTQCYVCQGYGHLASQCPNQNQTKILLVKVSIEDVEEDGLEVTVHQQDDDSDTSAEEREFNDCIRTLAVSDLTPSYDRAQLGVVWCILAQPE